MSEANIEEVVKVWKDYVATMPDWQEVVKGVTPKQTQCGPVYEPPSPLSDRTETFAVSDMRDVKLATPHYHKNGETEMYFVVRGSGLTVVGGEQIELEPGVVVVTPPEIAHFTIPEKDLVMVVINSPSFKAENIVEVEESNPEVGFSTKQLERLEH